MESKKPAWRYSENPPLDGQANMRIDRLLLELCENSRQPLSWLRLYRWAWPTISLGCHQESRGGAQPGAWHLHSLPLVKRPTGGRAVFHGHDLTYAVASNDPELLSGRNISTSYQLIANALKAGLARLGIPVLLTSRPTRRSTTRGANRDLRACFSSSSRHELVWQGRKLVGSAQRRLRRSFLQQGTIPLTIDYDRMSEVLGVNPKQLAGSMVSCSEAGGRSVSYRQLADALKEGFKDTFDVGMSTSPRTWGSLSVR